MTAQAFETKKHKNKVRIIVCALLLTALALLVPSFAWADIPFLSDAIKEFNANLASEIEALYKSSFSTAFLTATFSDQSDFSIFYEYIVAASEGISTPLALTVFSLVALLDIGSSMANNNTTSGGLTTIEIVYKLLLKFIVVYFLILNADTIMCAVFNIGQAAAEQMMTALSGVGSGVTNDGTVGNGYSFGFSDFAESSNPLDVLVLGFVWIGVILQMVVVNFICFIRLLTAAILVIGAPIALLLFAHQETKSMAIGYIRNMLAVAIQGLIIAFILGLYPVLLSDQIINIFIWEPAQYTTGGATLKGVAAIIMAVIVIFITLKSSSFAKQIVGA